MKKGAGSSGVTTQTHLLSEKCFPNPVWVQDASDSRLLGELKMGVDPWKTQCNCIKYPPDFIHLSVASNYWISKVFKPGIEHCKWG